MTQLVQERVRQKALVVMAHPAKSSLTREVTTAIVAAWQAAGHDAELADLAAEGFDPVFGAADHAAFNQAGDLPEDVRAEQRRLDRADHLILVHPVYWWSMPALLKGWIDRVFVAGWAFDEDADGHIDKRLGRLKITLIAIAGASERTYAKRGYRGAMRVQIENGIFDFCGASVIASRLVTPDQLAQPSAPQAIANEVVALTAGI
jgi:NAD(P)H dehydrogenase (quinone)